MQTRLLTAASLILLLGFLSAEQPTGFTTLKIGDTAPPFDLIGTDGKRHTLSDYAEPKVLMLYFTGTHCPTSHGIEARLQKLVKEMANESFQVLAINPNNDAGMRPDEYGYSHYTESFSDSQRYAKDLGWTFPFLYDGEQQVTAKAYGCLATPHVFIFDAQRKLRYQGSFDDSRFAAPETVKKHYAKDAVHALLADQEVTTTQTRPFGCSTKWKEKATQVLEDQKNWASLPTRVEEIDLHGVKQLRQNNTGKVRLINVWQTNCAPCLAELPDFVALSKKFSRREFEIITLSLDPITEKENVKTLLGKHHLSMSPQLEKTVKEEGRTTNHYLYTGSDLSALADALSPNWSGSLPYNLLLDGSGKILTEFNGKIDPQEVINHTLSILKTHWTQ